MSLISCSNFYRYADTVGDGTGVKDHVSDYSVTPGAARLDAAAMTLLRVERLLVSYQDASGFRASRYGNLGAALTNGIAVKHLDAGGGVIQDLTDASPVLTNAGWGALCYDVDVKSWGAGDEVLVCRWTFSKAGKAITVRPGERLAVEFNDDLSGLVSHRFQFQGRQLVFDDAGTLAAAAKCSDV